jgi:hypothetical protein
MLGHRHRRPVAKNQFANPDMGRDGCENSRCVLLSILKIAVHSKNSLYGLGVRHPRATWSGAPSALWPFTNHRMNQISPLQAKCTPSLPPRGKNESGEARSGTKSPCHSHQPFTQRRAARWFSQIHKWVWICEYRIPNSTADRSCHARNPAPTHTIQTSAPPKWVWICE